MRRSPAGNFVALPILDHRPECWPGRLRAQGWQRGPVLSQVLLKQLVRGAAGLLWVGPDEGLLRYDDYELVPLRAGCLPPGPAQSLPGPGWPPRPV